MGKWIYWKIPLLTCLGSYPFLHLMWELWHLEPQELEVCNESCIGLRYFGDIHIPSTRLQHLNATGASQPESWWLHGTNQIFHRYVLVQNGHPIQSSSVLNAIPSALVGILCPPGVTFVLFELAVYGMEQIQALWQPDVHQKFLSPACPRFNADEMKDHCSSKAMRDRVENDLQFSHMWISWTLYIFAFCSWTLLKILHDLALLHGWSDNSQTFSLKLGLGSVAAQILATALSFWITFGAASMFVAPDAEDPSCACYYMLQPFPMFLLCLAPCLLLYMTLAKIGGMAGALFHGDYLFAVSYDVPFHMAKAAQPENPAGPMHCSNPTMLEQNSSVNKSFRSQRGVTSVNTSFRSQPLSFQHFCSLADTFGQLYQMLLTYGLGTVVVILTGPLCLRLYLLVVARHAQYASFPLVFVTGYAIYKVVLFWPTGSWQKKMLCEEWVLIPTALTTLGWLALDLSQGQDALSRAWEIHFISSFLFDHLMIDARLIYRPQWQALQMFALQGHLLIPWDEDILSDWRKFRDEHPSWRLDGPVSVVEEAMEAFEQQDESHKQLSFQPFFFSFLAKRRSDLSLSEASANHRTEVDYQGRGYKQLTEMMLTQFDDDGFDSFPL